MDLHDAKRTLGLAANPTPNEARSAYRRLARRWHPDLVRPDHPGRLLRGAKMKELNEAYRVITTWLSSGERHETSRDAQRHADSAEPMAVRRWTPAWFRGFAWERWGLPDGLLGDLGALVLGTLVVFFPMLASLGDGGFDAGEMAPFVVLALGTTAYLAMMFFHTRAR